jgi:cytoskeletal protein RodZ
MDVGAALRDARERRGISLDQLAKVTKIRVITLQAIEANQSERLPEVFLRGFVRACAREVGLDPEDTVRQYLLQFGAATRTSDSAAADMSRTHAEPQPLLRSEVDPDEAERRLVRRELWIGLAMLVSGAAAYATISWWRAPALPAERSATVANAPAIPKSSSVSGSSTLSPAARVESTPVDSDEATGTTADKTVHLEIHAQGLCWLSAMVDGRRVVYRLMQAGEQYRTEVRDQAVLRVGDAAALALAINGKEGRPLGRPGEPVRTMPGHTPGTLSYPFDEYDGKPLRDGRQAARREDVSERTGSDRNAAKAPIGLRDATHA